jgi:hypothetical protein
MATASQDQFEFTVNRVAVCVSTSRPDASHPHENPHKKPQSTDQSRVPATRDQRTTAAPTRANDCCNPRYTPLPRLQLRPLQAAHRGGGLGAGLRRGAASLRGPETERGSPVLDKLGHDHVIVRLGGGWGVLARATLRLSLRKRVQNRP